jgi:hypothetical protein
LSRVQWTLDARSSAAAPSCVDSAGSDGEAGTAKRLARSPSPTLADLKNQLTMIEANWPAAKYTLKVLSGVTSQTLAMG